MEDRKINELKDEALDSVTGGAYWKYNEETGKYDVFLQDGTWKASYSDRDLANHAAASLSLAERLCGSH